MPIAQTLIQTYNIGSGGIASVTFASIPQTYTDLLITASVRTARTGASTISDGLELRLNNTTSGYSGRFGFTDGSSASTQSYTATAGLTVSANAATANIFSNSQAYIPNYTSSGFKTINSENCAENNAVFGYVLFDTALWSNTAAITSIVCIPTSATNILEHSTISLYGISKS